MIPTEMLELIMGINSLQGIFKAEQFGACVVQHLEHSESTSNFYCANKSHPALTRGYTYMFTPWAPPVLLLIL